MVKVQRPGLKELFDIDLKNIRWGLARAVRAARAAVKCDVACAPAEFWTSHVHLRGP